MREHSRDYGRLEDILKYARNVETIVSGITYSRGDYSRGDRYLSHSSRHTQVPVPATIISKQ